MKKQIQKRVVTVVTLAFAAAVLSGCVWIHPDDLPRPPGVPVPVVPVPVPFPVPVPVPQ